MCTNGYERFADVVESYGELGIRLSKGICNRLWSILWNMVGFITVFIVTGGALIGGVEGKTAIILDDLISTGGTLLRAAKACRAAGARQVFAAAAHGLFTGGAPDLFASSDFDGLVVADTVPLSKTIPSAARERLTILDSTGLVATAIAKVHGDG